MYAFDLARGLLALGHSPVLYSPRPGALAELIRRETVPVVDDLDRLRSPPDIIHGQHADETVTALLRFPEAPAVYVCHDWYFSKDAPPRFPRVLRYVAVDSACRDKLVFEHGVPEERVSVLLQFVDLAVGSWVVVYWWRRLGPPVTLADFERLRRDNFGLRAMGAQLTPEEFGRGVEQALTRYDPAEAARVSERVRAEAGRDSLVSEFVSLYESAIAEHAAAGGARDEEAEARAAGAGRRDATKPKESKDKN